jgi:nucleoid DNA-binding protein
MLEKYIKELLFDHDCVVLPEFGGFITHYASASIHPITHKFNPPARRVAFNEQLKLNDGLLITTLSVKEGISKEEAGMVVKEFSEKVKFQLNRYNQFIIKDIGRFFYNKESRLEFEPDTKVNFLDESFGFTELYFKPIEREFKVNSKVDPKPVSQRSAIEKPEKMKNVEPGTKSQNQSKGLSPIIFIIPVLLLIGGAGLAYYMNQEGKSLSSLNPLSWFSDSQPKESELTVTRPAPADPAPVVEEAEPVPANNESLTISERTGRYYIVIGCFSNKENAFKLKDQVTAQAEKVSIIEPYKGKPYYTLCVADFDNKKVAVNKMVELRATYGNTIWVKKY